MKKKLFLISILILALIVFTSSVSAQSITPTPVDTTSAPESDPTPSGQIVSLDFIVSGIGNEGGNTSPRNVLRNVKVYFFSPEINAEDTSTRPVGSTETTVKFDSDPQSPTFGSFVNSRIDLGNKIPDGKYQIVFKMDQALSFLVKESPGDIGGKIFDLRGVYAPPIVITGQKVIIGDIYPSIKGDNVMDINDYNELVSCFGAKAESESCHDFKAADLDDDGKIDGVDYNLMFGSFKTLLTLGKPVPKFIKADPTPKPTEIVKKKIVSPTPKISSVKEKATSNISIGRIIMFVVVALIFVFLIVFIIWKRQRAVDFFAGMLHKNESTDEISQDDVPKDTPEEAVDKEFFVKKQTEIKENNTIVLTLTDDNGPTLGYYSGKDVVDGFARVKGVMKKEGSKVFVDVSEITPVEPAVG